MEDMRKMVDELVFGDGVSRPMDISATRLNNNVVVVGATGAGKTTATAIDEYIKNKNA